MHSVEKYLAKLVHDFFNNNKTFVPEVNKEILEYIHRNSNISFENLYVKCHKDESGFSGFVAAKCTPQKVQFKVFVKM